MCQVRASAVSARLRPFDAVTPMAQEKSIVICGLPGSGKTTFLAALWHLVTSREVATRLSFQSLRNGDQAYLNEIANRWRFAKVQEHTKLGPPKVVCMNLLDTASKAVRLTFPDLSGESYQRMWEEREVDPDVAAILRERSAVLLFLHGDQIQPPQWTVDVAAMSKRLGLPVEPGKPVPWHPRLAPTQVQVVELLQLLRGPELDVGARRVAVVISAWDKVAPEGRTPSTLLEERMPLLQQYLDHGELGHPWKVFGCSAQGGDYEPPPDSKIEWSREEVKTLRLLDKASDRIQLVADDTNSHDLTEPIAWLTE